MKQRDIKAMVRIGIKTACEMGLCANFNLISWLYLITLLLLCMGVVSMPPEKGTLLA